MADLATRMGLASPKQVEAAFEEIMDIRQRQETSNMKLTEQAQAMDEQTKIYEELKKRQESTDQKLLDHEKLIKELTEQVEKLSCGASPQDQQVALPLKEQSKLTEESKKLLEASTYTMNDSIWDATLLLFVGHASKTDYVILVFGALVNITFQILLLITIMYNMLTPEFNPAKVAQMLEWRVTDGQHATKLDGRTGLSLTHSLCTQAGWSFEQSQYDQIYDYLYKAIPGTWLSVMAIFLWVLTCMSEYRSLTEQFLAILNLPAAQRDENGNLVTIDEREDGDYIIGIKSSQRIIAFVCLSVPRLAVLILLCVVGCIWLARTVSLADIVLNAVALAFVLDIDEALCQVLFSHRLKTTMERVQPLSCGKSKKVIGGIAIKDLIRYTVTISILLATIFSEVIPYRDSVESAAIALCGGNWEFTYSGGVKSNPTVTLAPTNDWTDVCDGPAEELYERKYYGMVNNNTNNKIKKNEALRNLTRYNVLSYAFKDCEAGMVMDPNNEVPAGTTRPCKGTANVLSDKLKAYSVTAGQYSAPPSCPRFNPFDAARTAKQCGTALPPVCQWSWLSYACESNPPGTNQITACSTNVVESCSVWQAWGLHHPTLNCEASMCDENPSCLSVIGAITYTGDSRLFGTLSQAARNNITAAFQYGLSVGIPKLPKTATVAALVRSTARLRRLAASTGTVSYNIMRMGASVLESDLKNASTAVMAGVNARLKRDMGQDNLVTSVTMEWQYKKDEALEEACEWNALNCDICFNGELCPEAAAKEQQAAAEQQTAAEGSGTAAAPTPSPSTAAAAPSASPETEEVEAPAESPEAVEAKEPAASPEAADEGEEVEEEAEVPSPAP